MRPDNATEVKDKNIPVGIYVQCISTVQCNSNIIICDNDNNLPEGKFFPTQQAHERQTAVSTVPHT